MFKRQFLAIAILLFVIVNTRYLWEGLLGLLFILVLIAIAIIYLLLVFQVFRQVYLSIKEKFKSKDRLLRIGVVTILLTLIVLRPFGIINYSAYESKSILVAEREGVANCTTTLLLKESGRFKMRSVCFGVDEEIGTYTFNKDTVRLNYGFFIGRENGFKYGILDTANKSLMLYRGEHDTLPYPLHVSKNEIKRH